MERPASDNAVRYRFPGLGAYVSRIQKRLAGAPGAAELAELHQSLIRHSRQLEISLSAKRGTVHLTPASRALRGWLRFVSDEASLHRYVDAVGECSAALDQNITAQRRWKSPVHVFFRPIRGLYQARQTPTGFELSLPIAAVCLSGEDWSIVSRCVILEDKSAKRAFINRTLAEDYRAVAGELEALGGETADAVGRVYDLDVVFNRVNAAYFNGEMKRPRLVWSRSPTFRKFGHYDWIGDAVMLSRTLDSQDVPAFVVDFIMYHELLHKAHGIKWTSDGSRGYAHTARFYRDEKRFAQYEAAEAAIKRLARSGRKARR